jgi:folate-binding protein YgfZ
VRSDNPAVDWYELWVAPEHASPIRERLVKESATPVGTSALELVRVACGIPRYGQDIRERDLPQETEQTRALNFNKGCYIGQEIVERIRSRGAVHRKFSGFLADGSGPIAAGTRIACEGKDVGEVTSSTSLSITGRSKTIALGYIRREVAAPGRAVMIGETKATIVDLPAGDSSTRVDMTLQEHPA